MPLIHDRTLRGNTKTGWLDSAHTFSMGGFHDPRRMGHRALRIVNEDRVIPGAGFATHSHQDMDIMTYVIAGALSHKDSLGNGSTIQPSEIQLISAGTGITHSEMNASDAEPVHFMQIWIIPEQLGIEPTYQQKSINEQETKNALHPIATPKGSHDAVRLNSDTSVYLSNLDGGLHVQHEFAEGRGGFLQLLSGRLIIENEILQAGDGLQFDATRSCRIVAKEDSEFLLFDLK